MARGRRGGKQPAPGIQSPNLVAGAVVHSSVARPIPQAAPVSPAVPVARSKPGPIKGKLVLKDVQSAIDTFSAGASANTRQLAFGGIALVWVIKIGKVEAGGVPWTNDLFLPLALFAGALLADLLQYVWGALAWSDLQRRQEKVVEPTELFGAPLYINRITAFFFIGKVALVGTGYVMVIRHLVTALGFP